MVNKTAEKVMHANETSGAVSKAIDVKLITEIDAAISALETIAQGAQTTGHQHPNFVRAWLTAGDIEPVFITLQAAGFGPVLLPLERASGGTAHYVGGKHANGNFPIGKPQDIEALAGQANTALEQCSDLQALGINALALERQHAVWKGVANPFVEQHSVCSPNVALSFSVEEGFDAIIARCGGAKRRKKFRSQMRKLEAIGPLEIVIPVGIDETAATLETFFRFKADRFREVGIPDVFADDGTRAAFMDMFMTSALSDTKVHELHMLKAGDELAAIMGCTVNDGHLTVEFSTFNPQYAHVGPGEQLFFLSIEDACRRGLSVYDFGVGDERFKRTWSDIETWHKDTFIAVSTRGQLTRLSKQMRSTMVRSLKNNEQLWKTAKAARRKLGGLRA